MTALEHDGVELFRNAWKHAAIAPVIAEYHAMDATLTNQDIPKNQPVVVFWKHVIGEQKRIATLEQMPALASFIEHHIIPTLLARVQPTPVRLQLLETIIFAKPGGTSNTLHWHQDVAYFPLQPREQLATWCPFDLVTRERGAMIYALGSHKEGIRRSDNLHTREAFKNDERQPIPEDPALTYPTACYEMTPQDLIVHDGYTWHMSGPCLVEGHNRLGLSVRFITDEAVFSPGLGDGAAFRKQIEIAPGEVLRSPAFPVMWGEK